MMKEIFVIKVTMKRVISRASGYVRLLGMCLKPCLADGCVISMERVFRYCPLNVAIFRDIYFSKVVGWGGVKRYGGGAQMIIG